jgi:hypothetical protein
MALITNWGTGIPVMTIPGMPALLGTVSIRPWQLPQADLFE